ncbi:YfbR-like 5'-deoxynucleotidase [Ancylobacter radicis]|uniref:HD family hydrolase n=1 Tax=Ancylobacter radicis TaxID=2836179 RepID=A0ABS5R6P8_9HYPH|nr:HD family hydrolase [Ancylobacter radicis]MBS9477336.1 HD family hydrolase [Ancylobacter radicis]
MTSPAKPARVKPQRVWQRMLSGRRLDLIDPSPLDIEIEDIAHGLARVARWNGQTAGAHIFSVAQHSVLVELIARRQASARGADLAPRWLLATLLHDAPEYVVGDMISPFKAVLGGDYKEVEARLLAAVSLRFGLPALWPAALVKLVKAADRASAFLEATRLAGFEISEARAFFGAPCPLDPALESDYLTPWSAGEAKDRFLARFRELAELTRAAPDLRSPS